MNLNPVHIAQHGLSLLASANVSCTDGALQGAQAVRALLSAIASGQLVVSEPKPLDTGAKDA